MATKKFSTEQDLVKHLRETGLILWTNEDERSLFDTVSPGVRNLAIAVHAQSPQRQPSGGRRDNAAPGPYSIVITEDLFTQLMAHAKAGEADFWKHTTRSFRRAFVFLDISDFSKMVGIEQQIAISSLIESAHRAFGHRYPEAQLCIGDGYVYVYRDATQAASFAADLATALERLLPPGS